MKSWSHHTLNPQRSRPSLLTPLCLSSALGLAAGCAPGDDLNPELDGLDEQNVLSGNGFSANGFSSNGLPSNGLSGNGVSANGLSTNGISANGLSVNGLSSNGLSTNGLSANGLSSNGFKGWFAENPAFHAHVLKYVVRCALPEGQQVIFTDSTGAKYTFKGALGLVPSLSSRGPNVDEQEILSACLMALVNSSGLHGVMVSLRGKQPTAAGPVDIPVSDYERVMFMDYRKEVFFGNLFLPSPVKRSLPKSNQTTRVWDAPASTWGRECATRPTAPSRHCGEILNPTSGECSYPSTTDDTATHCVADGVTWNWPITVWLPTNPELSDPTKYPCAPGGCPPSFHPQPYWYHVGTRCDGSTYSWEDEPYNYAIHQVVSRNYVFCWPTTGGEVGWHKAYQFPDPWQKYGVEIRYSNGTSGNTYLRFRCGNLPYTTVALPPTGGWHRWDRFFIGHPVQLGWGEYQTCDVVGPASGPAPYVNMIARSALWFNEEMPADHRAIMPWPDPSASVSASPIAHWKMSSGSGGVVADASGNGHTGVLKNGAFVTSAGTLALDGLNDFVDTGVFDVPSYGLSITAVAKSTNLSACGSSNDCRILSKAIGTDENDHTFMLSTVKASNGQTYLRFRLKTDGVTKTLVATSGAIVNNESFKAAATYDGFRMRLYKNGVEVGSTDKTGSVTTGTGQSVWIGANPPNAAAPVRQWKGEIDDVRIYNRALSPVEVSAL